MMRAMFLYTVLAMAGCSHHLDVKADATGTEHASAVETTHAATTRREEPTRIVTVTRKPDGTVRERTVYKGAVAVKRELEKDAKTLFDGEQESHTETEKDSKPLGIFAFLAGNWLWLLLAIPVLIVVFRKKLAPLLKLLPFRIPFLSP